MNKTKNYPIVTGLLICSLLSSHGKAMEQPAGYIEVLGQRIPWPLTLDLSISKATCINLLGLGSGITGMAIIYQSAKSFLQNNPERARNTVSEISRGVIGFGSGIAFLAAGIATLRRG